jgi:hypothetical protein
MVHRVSVTAKITEEAKKILLDRNGDTNRIIQAHLNFLEGLPSVKSASPDELNITFSDCQRGTQELRTLG